MCKCAPALLTLRDQIDARWPSRSTASDGCCASSAHHQQNPSSDHEPDAAGFAHAFDITNDATHGPNLDVLASLLMVDHRIKYLIFQRRIWFPKGKPGGRPAGWSAYTGPNPHTKHLHCSIVATATHDALPWPINAVPPLGPTSPLPVPPEVEMFLYRESNTKVIKLYEGKGRIRSGLTETIATDLLTVLDQRPGGPGTDRKEWVLSKETVAWLEGNA